MATRKEILENLSMEINHLAQSVDNNSQISDEIIHKMQSLKSDLERIMTQGAKEIRNSIITGSIIGGVISSAIKNAIENRNDDPHMIIAKRIYNTLLVIGEAYQRGERNDHSDTLRLLKIHNLTDEQAEHILDLLLNQAGVLNVFEDESGKEFIMIDNENKNFKTLNEGYINNTYVYPNIVNAGQNEESDE